MKGGMLSFKKDALLIFVLLALAYGYFYQDPGFNGNSHLGLTFAIVQEGRLTIDSFYKQEGLETGDKSVFNGHYYSDKAIGLSIISVIFYLPLYWLSHLFQFSLSVWQSKYYLTFFVIGLPSAFTGSLIYVFCKYLSSSQLRAYIVTLAIALGTMALPFSLVFFSHQLAGSILFSAFFLIFLLKLRSGTVKNWIPFLTGLLLGLALITEYTTFIIVIPLVVYYFYVLWKKQLFHEKSLILLPAFGGLIPILVLFAYNWLIYGNPLSIGYEHLSASFYGNSMAQGLMGIGWPQLKVLYYLTVHPAMGLFWQSPVLLMAIVGAYGLFRSREYRAEAILTTVAVVAYLLMNSGYFMWWGGKSFGPRLLIPMLPFLCLPLIFVPRRLFPGVVILGIVSIAQMFIVAASEVLTPVDFTIGIDQAGYFQYSTIYSYCLKQLIHHQFAWNLGIKLFGLKNWSSLLPILIAMIGTTIFFSILNQQTSDAVILKQLNREV